MHQQTNNIPFTANERSKVEFRRISMNKILSTIVISACLSLSACEDTSNYNTAVYLLLDTSGTYTKELRKAQLVIKFMLSTLQAGDSFAVARIDSGSFSEKDIIAKATFDARPSASNRQKREFASAVDKFIRSVKGSKYTDISGGLLQGTEYLNETKAGSKYILIYSDLKEDLPAGYKRDFEISLDGYSVLALNVTKLRSDNIDPVEYLLRVESWEQRVTDGGGDWFIVNDIEKEGALDLANY
jgi:hypothetical protein